MLIRLLLIILAAASMSSCGYHLRGQLPLADSLKLIHVKSPNVLMRDAMADALEGTGARVVDDPETPGAALLDLYDVTYDRRVRTIDTRGKVTGYTLQYTVSYRVTTAGGDELQAGGPLLALRDINYDPDQVLQKEDEEFILRRDMERDISQRILRQLSTVVHWRAPAGHRLAVAGAQQRGA